VLAIGPSVKRFRVGDRVWGSNEGCSGGRSDVLDWLASVAIQGNRVLHLRYRVRR
jgi:hypothetical protein